MTQATYQRCREFPVYAPSFIALLQVVAQARTSLTLRLPDDEARQRRQKKAARKGGLEVLGEDA
ncbi:hypothetical protein [Sphingobium lactosutens]|jgi:hypothetical protein|uniref:hypothetical protein n=1 Tax=Sphingobium lactosutens TaxID=522773 RepID=UPI001D194B42|nr:hypothetical protein [Sphingobium lactosutens]MCC4256521.1 hypothetical protein [Sphingobium lactosutens]|tara:strand:- start:1195 stop:1386 length:192 start_codon:yes stop_codon:yes gene_type:complete